MNKKPYFRGRPKRIDGPDQIFSAPDLITVKTAVSAITKAVQPKYELWSTARAKVFKCVHYAIKKGRLQPDSNDQLIFGELAAWARTIKRWRTKLSLWPAYFHLELTDELSVSDECDMASVHLPQTLDECHTEIRRMSQQLAEGKRDNRRLSKEVEDLRPKAERYEKICQQNRISARKPRDV